MGGGGRPLIREIFSFSFFRLCTVFFTSTFTVWIVFYIYFYVLLSFLHLLLFSVQFFTPILLCSVQLFYIYFDVLSSFTVSNITTDTSQETLSVLLPVLVMLYYTNITSFMLPSNTKMPARLWTALGYHQNKQLINTVSIFLGLPYFWLWKQSIYLHC